MTNVSTEINVEDLKKLVTLSNSNTPAETVMVLLDDPDEHIVAFAYSHPRLPENVFKQIVNENRRNITLMGIELLHNDFSKLKIIYEHTDYSVRMNVINIGTLSAEMLHYFMLRENNTKVLEAIVQNSNVGENTLRHLSEHSSSNVRDEVAYNIKTPKDVIKKLCQDIDDRVKMTAHMNPHTELTEYFHLFRHAESFTLLNMFASEDNLSAKDYFTILRKVEAMKDEKKLQRIAKSFVLNDAVSSEILEHIFPIAEDKDYFYCFLSHPNVTANIIHKIYDHAIMEEDFITLENIVKNPETSLSTLECILKKIDEIATRVHQDKNINSHKYFTITSFCNGMKIAIVQRFAKEHPSYKDWPDEWFEVSFQLKHFKAADKVVSR